MFSKKSSIVPIFIVFLRLQMPNHEKDNRELTKIKYFGYLKILVPATLNEIKSVSADVMVQTNF